MNPHDACTEHLPSDAQHAGLFVLTGDAESAQDEVSVSRSIRALLRLVREQMRLDVVFIGEIVNDTRVFRYIDSAVQPHRVPEGHADPLDETLCQRILDGRLPPVIPNVNALVRSEGLRDNFLDLGAYIGVPVRLRDGTVYGFLCGFNLGGECMLDDRDLRRMEVAAKAAARLLDHARGNDHGADPALM